MTWPIDDLSTDSLDSQNDRPSRREFFKSLNLKFYFAYQCLASLRVRRRILATSAQAVELSIVRSQSLANRRHLPSHAKVRSTTHRLGSRTKPFALSGRLTVSSVHSSPMACRSLSPAYPPSVKIWRKHGNFLPAALSRSGKRRHGPGCWRHERRSSAEARGRRSQYDACALWSFCQRHSRKCLHFP